MSMLPSAFLPANHQLPKKQLSKKLFSGILLLSLLSVGCGAQRPKQSEAADAKAVNVSESNADTNAAASLVGTWQMQLADLAELEQLPEAERRQLVDAMEELTFAMTFTADGKVKSSVDDQVTDYSVRGNQVVVNGDAMTFKVTDNQLTLTGPDQTLKFIRTDKDVEAFSSNAFASGAQRAKESEAKTYTGAMNRAQQAYHLEHDSFAAAVEDLGVGIESETELYHYSTSGNADISFNRAVAKQNNLRSYVGAVFVQTTEPFATTESILCMADAPGPQTLSDPTVNDREVACPEGSSPVQ